MSIRRLLLAGLVLTGIALTGAGLTLRSGRAAVDTDHYERRIESCNPGERGTIDAGAIGKGEACLADVMIYAFENDDLETFLPVLESAVARSETLYTVCHPAAHTAGRYALDGGPEVMPLLDIVAMNTVCDWGFGHGVIDSLAERGDDPATLEDIVDWCERHVSDERLYGLCTDSVGHYSWTSTGDLAKSVANCEMLATDSGKTSCGGGILMQMFEPAAAAGSYTRQEAPELIPSICTSWFAVAGTPGGRNGCAMGAGYVYGLDVRDVTWALIEEYSRNPGGGLPLQHQERILETVRVAHDRCRIFEEEYFRTCTSMLAVAVPVLYARTYPEPLLEICAIFEDPYVTDRCTAQASQSNI
jgi:hypothetical protein